MGAHTQSIKIDSRRGKRHTRSSLLGLGDMVAHFSRTSKRRGTASRNGLSVPTAGFAAWARHSSLEGSSRKDYLLRCRVRQLEDNQLARTTYHSYKSHVNKYLRYAPLM